MDAVTPRPSADQQTLSDSPDSQFFQPLPIRADRVLQVGAGVWSLESGPLEQSDAGCDCDSRAHFLRVTFRRLSTAKVNGLFPLVT